MPATTPTTDNRTDAEKLESVRAELAEWRGLAYNAANVRHARSYGRCARAIERLERIETALARRVARGELPACDVCGERIEPGERYTSDPKGETTHDDCARDWFRRNFGREGLS